MDEPLAGRVRVVSDRIGARVSFHEYPDTDPEPRTWSTSPYVAVVLVEGTIIDGKSRHIPILNIHFTGGDTIAETLRELRSDWACKGIILRVNSPGGSALASDIIWREVDKTREAHQKSPKRSPPIVISMSDVAASGGYYISAGARDVYAQPTTITGSIGVVSMNFDLSGLLSKLGISTTTFKQGEHADINSLFRSMTPTEVERLTKSMRRTYDLFVKRVSEARGLTPEKVDELGRGHVYSGTDALALGLVDGLGGLPEAIARVRTMSRVPKPVDLEIRVLPRRRTLLDLILTGIGSPFGRRGAADKVYAKQAEKQRLPLALDAAVARLPLSILFLPSARVSALMPAVIEIE